jgi:hypothetical protein
LPGQHKLQETLIAAGHNQNTVVQLSKAQLSLAIVEYFRATLPNKDSSNPLYNSLNALKQARDKVIAHNESFPKSARSLSTWGGAEDLVSYAKDFVIVIGMGFLNLYMGNEISSYQDVANTRGTYVAMRQLIQKAMISKDHTEG